MFYSHEILNNPQHGVSTIWLASTLGFHSGSHKLSRKAIMEVQIEKACKTILQPGAPIALRLQGNLLFGVMKILEKQFEYMVADCEKAISDFNMLYKKDKRDSPSSRRRANLVLLDDPVFDLTLNTELPAFPVDGDGNFIDLTQSLAIGRKTSTRLTPLPGDSGFIFQSSLYSLNSFGDSSGLASHRMPDSFSRMSPTLFNRMTPAPYTIPLLPHEEDLVQFEEEEQALNPEDWMIDVDAEGNVRERPKQPPQHMDSDDWMLDIDSEGNVRPHVPQPSLPDLAMTHGAAGSAEKHGRARMLSDEEVPVFENSEDEDQWRPGRIEAKNTPQGGRLYADIPDTEKETTSKYRRIRHRLQIAPDEETTISRADLKAWSDNYVATHEEGAAKKQKKAGHVTPAIGKKNADFLIFGRGVADAGLAKDIGMPNKHYENGMVPFVAGELHSMFSGDALKSFILGEGASTMDDDRNTTILPQRRTVAAALESDAEGPSRRVRPRLSVEPERAREGLEVAELARGVEEAELGRDADMALADLPSDAPWIRPSSQMPSSSVKGGARVPGSQVGTSPNVGRGGQTVGDIERLSSEGFLPLPSDEADGSFPAAGTSQGASHPLVQEAAGFLAFAGGAARAKGVARADGRMWVDFDDLLEAEHRTKEVATRAFYQLLGLATKDMVKVEQDGYGPIRMGVKLANDADGEINA